MATLKTNSRIFIKRPASRNMSNVRGGGSLCFNSFHGYWLVAWFQVCNVMRVGWNLHKVEPTGESMLLVVVSFFLLFFFLLTCSSFLMGECLPILLSYYKGRCFATSFFYKQLLSHSPKQKGHGLRPLKL